MKNVINETINTDVLIIGGGIAGCLAAIKARETGLDVTIVDKANVGRSGTSHQMSGVLTYFDPEADDAGKWYEECIQAGEGLCDMERLRGMVEETADRVRDLEAWGVRFLKEKGKFIRKAGVGHLHAGNVILENGGFQLMSVIRGEVLRRGVRLIERVMVTDLLTSDGELPTRGKVTGAVGFGVRTGKSYLFSSRSTVITSGCTRAVDLTTAPMSSLSGDGRAMAFRAGCEMRNIELTHFSPGPTRFMCAPGLNILFGEGAIMTNARGERFMQNRDTVRIERAPRSVLSKAMALEMLEGRGPVFMDATRLDEASHRRIEMALPIVTMSFARGGLSLRKDKIEYDMRLTDLGPGGIRADSSGATCIPGLYAAGAASDHGEDGVSNVIGHGMESCIGGWRAGKGASEFSLRGEKPGFKDQQASELIEKTFKPLNRKRGINHRELRREIGKIRDEGLLGAIRTADRIKKAITAVDAIKASLPLVTAGDYHELTRVLGLGNELLFVELLAKCSLYRTESRGSHYREDYPERNDKNWLKWVIARDDGDHIRIWDQPVTGQVIRERI